MKPILIEKRATLLDQLRTAVDAEEFQQADVDELRGKIDEIDKRLEAQNYVDQQSRAKSQDEQFSDTARGYDLRKAILGVIDGKLTGREAEINTELKASNPKAAGNALLIPDEVFEKRTLTSPDTSAGKVLTESFRPGEFLRALRPMSVASAAGVRFFGGTGDKVLFPRQNAVSIPTWQTETGTVTDTDISFSDPIEFVPKRLSCSSSYSEMLLRQSGGGVPIQSTIVTDVMREMALAIDAQVFVGGQVASGTVTDVGNAPNNGILRKITSSSTLGATTSAVTYEDVLSLKLATKEANAPMSRPGFVTSPQVANKLMLTRLFSGANDSTTIMGFDGMVIGYPTQVTTTIPRDLQEKTTSPANNASALIWSSDWSQIAVCNWGNLSMIVDIYTSAKSGIINLIWSQYLDIQIIRSEAFAYLDHLER